MQNLNKRGVKELKAATFKTHFCICCHRTLSVEQVSSRGFSGGLSRGASMEDTRHAGCLPNIPGHHK